jgi:hypothetical protein
VLNRHTALRHRHLWAGAAVLALLAAGCSTHPSAARLAPKATSTTADPPSTKTTTTTAVTAPPTTLTTVPSFPPVVVQAMAQFTPLPTGAEAPVRIPSVPGYLTAETGGLGGQDNVTLIATAEPVPVNSPSLSGAAAGREVASFATTPTASASTASAALTQGKNESIDSCQGPSQSVSLAGGEQATSCPTLDGAALTWSAGTWEVQVVTLDGTTPSTAEAGMVDAELSSSVLPAATGYVSVVVPGSPSAGSADTAALEWTGGADVYQVRSSEDPASAIAVAAAMDPYPG